MDVDLRYTKELSKLLKKATKRDQIAFRQTIETIEEEGIEMVSTDTIRRQKGLKEVIIKADSEYRIIGSQQGDTYYGLSYCKKTSPQEQVRAIERAVTRLGDLATELKEAEAS